MWTDASGLCTASDAFFMKKDKIREEEGNANAVVLQCLFYCDMLFASVSSFFCVSNLNNYPRLDSVCLCLFFSFLFFASTVPVCVCKCESVCAS